MFNMLNSAVSGSDCVEIKHPLLSLRQLEVITHASSSSSSPTLTYSLTVFSAHDKSIQDSQPAVLSQLCRVKQACLLVGMKRKAAAL